LAQFGLTEDDVRGASTPVRSYLFDQYVRACGFVPDGSWVLIVLPSGECEFTTLQPGEPRWCCESRKQISARVGMPTVGLPPWAANVLASTTIDVHTLAERTRDAGEGATAMTSITATMSDPPATETGLPPSLDERLRTVDAGRLRAMGDEPRGADFDTTFDNSFDNIGY
jgi:hypothetical protein